MHNNCIRNNAVIKYTSCFSQIRFVSTFIFDISKSYTNVKIATSLYMNVVKFQMPVITLSRLIHFYD